MPFVPEGDDRRLSPLINTTNTANFGSSLQDRRGARRFRLKIGICRNREAAFSVTLCLGMVCFLNWIAMRTG